MRALTISSVFIVFALAAPAGAQSDGPSTNDDPYAERVRQGIQLLMGGDGAGARDAFRGAVALDGGRAEAPYYIAVTNRVAENFDEALSGFRRAVALARASDNQRFMARAMHGVASTLERIDGRLEEARTAWQEFVRFADEHTEIADAQVGRTRIQNIDVIIEQERAYTEVRRRITEREQAQEEESSSDSSRSRRR